MINKKISAVFPAFVVLKNKKEKVCNSVQDAYSWAKSLKSEILFVEELKVSIFLGNPSNLSILESNRLLGGSDCNFSESFLNDIY